MLYSPFRDALLLFQYQICMRHSSMLTQYMYIAHTHTYILHVLVHYSFINPLVYCRIMKAGPKKQGVPTFPIEGYE